MMVTIDLFKQKSHPDWMRPKVVALNPVTNLNTVKTTDVVNTKPGVYRDFYTLPPGTVFALEHGAELFLRINSQDVSKGTTGKTKWRNTINLTRFFVDLVTFISDMDTPESEISEVFTTLANINKLSEFEDLRGVKIFMNYPEPPEYPNYVNFHSFGNITTVIDVDGIVATGKFSTGFMDFIMEYISFIPQTVFNPPARTVWYQGTAEHD